MDEKDIVIFIVGALVSVAIQYVAHKVQTINSQRATRMFEQRFGLVISLINQAKNLSGELQTSLKGVEHTTENISSKIASIPTEIEKLLKEISKLSIVRQELERNVDQFHSFVKTVEAIRKYGVEVVTKDEQHPDLRDKIVLLFAKQSMWEKMGENVASAVGGAAAGYAYGRGWGSEGVDPVLLILNRLDSIESQIRHH